MISTFRDYELQDKNHFHAHIEVNPTGLLDVDIIEKMSIIKRSCVTSVSKSWMVKHALKEKKHNTSGRWIWMIEMRLSCTI